MAHIKQKILIFSMIRVVHSVNYELTINPCHAEQELANSVDPDYMANRDHQVWEFVAKSVSCFLTC